MPTVASDRWAAAEELSSAEESGLLSGQAHRRAAALPLWGRGALAAALAGGALLCLAAAGGLSAPVVRGAAGEAPAAFAASAAPGLVSAAEKKAARKPHGGSARPGATEPGNSTRASAGAKQEPKDEPPDEEPDDDLAARPKEQYLLVTADFDKKGNNSLSVKLGEVVKQLGDGDGGWAWVEKVGEGGGGRDGKEINARAGYVPEYIIEPMPEGNGHGNGTDTTAALAERHEERKGGQKHAH